MSDAEQASFQTGAMVTYGSHGIGTVEEYVRETVLDQDLYLYKLRFGNGKVIKVPETVAKRDFKPLVVTSQIDAVIAILRQPPVKKRGPWHRKEASHADVFGTQDATALAKLVRDLHPRESSPSYAGLTLYRNGLYQLVQLLTVTEGVNDAAVLKRLNDETELVFRPEDAQPISYGANARSVKPRPAVSEYQYEAAPSVRQAATRPFRPTVPKQIAVTKPKSSPLPKVRERTPLAAKEVGPKPARTKVVSQAPVTRVVKQEPMVQVSPHVDVAAVVATATEALEAKNQSLQDTIRQLRETIKQQQGENKNLQSTSASASGLEAQLATARSTITSLRSQLTQVEQQKSTVTRERQRIDREQSGREAFQIARIKELGETVGVFFSMCCLLAATLQEKMATLARVQALADASSVDATDTALQQHKELLRHARRTNSMRKRRIEVLEEEQKSLRREQKELKRLEALVVAQAGTIASLTKDAVTATQIQAEIERVRVELFQYIFERTGAVERLEAYIRELTERSKT